MKSRALAVVATATAIVAAGVVGAGPVALAGSRTLEPAAACPPDQFCLWSGANYTGQMATLSPSHPWGDCVSAASLGLPAIRSAKKNGVACQFQATLHADGGCGQSTEPAFVEDQTPTIDPPALSLNEVLIPC